MTVSPPSRENRFCPMYLVCRKVSNASALFSRPRMYFCSSIGRLLVLDLDPLLDPLALRRVHDVHVLDADGAAVGVAQHPEDVAQLHELLAVEPADRELPVQVPQGQAVGEHVQVGVPALPVVQRVGVGHQVPAGAVGVDDLQHPGGLVHRAVPADVEVLDPADRLVRQPQRGEDVVVEAVLADQQLVDAAAGTRRTRRPG